MVRCGFQFPKRNFVKSRTDTLFSTAECLSTVQGDCTRRYKFTDGDHGLNLSDGAAALVPRFGLDKEHPDKSEVAEVPPFARVVLVKRVRAVGTAAVSA